MTRAASKENTVFERKFLPAKGSGRARLRLWLRRTALACGAVVLLGAGTGAGWVVTRPGLDEMMAQARPMPRLEASNGDALLLARGVTTEYVPFDEIPRHVVDAVVALEDRRFRSHGGVDFRSIARAMVANVTAGEVVEGGSTITQQLVKISYLTPERTLKRKAHEAVLAHQLERRHSKDEILEMYLNRVYMGNGARGMGPAARLYFGKPLQDVTLPEAAALAATIRAPSVVNPLGKTEALRDRATLVVRQMEKQGRIDASAANIARVALATMSFRPHAPSYDGWFADWVAPESEAIAARLEGDVTFRTTLDPDMQIQAETAVRAVLSGTQMEAALVALRPDGTVAAMVGGRNYEESQFNRATEAMRQPGSTFKTFVYLAALAQGYSPEDRIADRPVDIDGYRPQNMNGRYAGDVRMIDAFARSLNAAAVNVAMDVGIDRVAEVARLLGIEAELTETPSLALGTSEVSLLDLTEAYAGIATGQAPVIARGLEAIATDGSVLSPLSWPEPPASRRTLEILDHTDQMARLLRAVVTDGTGRAVADIPGAAGKTGTTQDYRDALFVGWNQDLIVGVWVGNDDNTPMDEVTGGKMPAEIWKRFLESVGETDVPADTPAALVAEAELPELTLAAASLPMSGVAATRAARAPSATLRNVSAVVGALASAPACNMRACERAYRSFRASDCTFQPYGNRPRELCTR